MEKNLTTIIIITTANFNLVPFPLNVTVEQGTATFPCQHSLAVAIGWRINGILLNTANFQNISTTSTSGPSGVTTHILSIGTLLDHNATIIECVATFFDGSSPEFTAPVALLIQGTCT